ncbi:MAG TPA: DUF5989 family protein [Vicinamibacterales bacterium]|nr:DUF5989 family protein [Vicinamibacterales bacterium]
MAEQPLSDFEKVSQQSGSNNLLTDFGYYLRHSRKWWLVPLLLALSLLGGLMLLSNTAAAPFIYTLF